MMTGSLTTLGEFFLLGEAMKASEFIEKLKEMMASSGEDPVVTIYSEGSGCYEPGLPSLETKELGDAEVEDSPGKYMIEII